ncbi:MAG: hypothetical protein IKD70_10030, partial [Eggerthellaceae bacterium]|nr:hypothetical protein [Eggerthellaceae bacterium]
LESVFGVLFSVMFYGETLTIRVVMGFALIFLAILLSELGADLRRRLQEKKARKDGARLDAQ